MNIIGKSFNSKEFIKYCQEQKWTNWKPKFIVLHNTGVPTLSERPNGLTEQHILNLESYYTEQGWHEGPHLFIDDKQIWVFCPLTISGVHSPSWNSISLGIEMLGDFSIEQFNSGRGLLVKILTISAIKSLCSTLDIPLNTIRFHKEDPKTTHKNCPGKNVDKTEFIKELYSI